MRIGEFLVQKRLIHGSDIEPILRHSERTGLRFGDAALDLGLLRKQQLIDLFGPDYRTDFFHLDAAYFPRVTREWFAVEQILKWGALPLGLKTHSRFGFLKETVLNVGQLTPSRKEVLSEVRSVAADRADAIKVYLVLFDEYLTVLEQEWGWSADRIRAQGKSQLDPTLALFLGVD